MVLLTTFSLPMTAFAAGSGAGMTKTSHTLNEVECIYVAKDAPGTTLAPEGKLCDIAPTALALLGLEIPAEMTAKNLVVSRPNW